MSKAVPELVEGLQADVGGGLWLLLKGKQLDGRKFRRQHSVGKYTLDFYCPSEKLAVELNGEWHLTAGLRYTPGVQCEFQEALRFGMQVIEV